MAKRAANRVTIAKTSDITNNDTNNMKNSMKNTTTSVTKGRVAIVLSRLYIGMLVLFISLISSVVSAERQIDILTDTQLVLDQSMNLRQQAMRTSLSAVFVRVTGDSQVVSQPIIQEALSTPSAYVSQYRYANTDEVITIAGASRPAQQLWLQFSQSAIERLLQNAQLPVWSDIRPEILLWVATDNSGRRIADAGSSPVQTLKRLAQARGVPLVLPSLDLTDRRALTSARLWARDETAIKNASSRYGADGVLAGRIVTASANIWRANFILMYNQRSHYFSAESDNTTSLLQNIINQMTQVLAQTNSVVINDDAALPSVLIAVDNVTRFSTYADILKRFSALSSVSHVMLQEVNKSYLLINVHYQGSQDRVWSQLKVIKRLEAISLSEFLAAYPQNIPLVAAESTIDIDTPIIDESIEGVEVSANKKGNDGLDDTMVGEINNGEITSVITSTLPIIDAAFMWRESQ
ncbi:MAG: hypothetical protein ACJAZJ_000901 [Candidatus Endobugula sp.]|jgi:hypothetical protein